MAKAGNLDTFTRVFSVVDQNMFAELSGDSNPVHVDAIYSRKVLAGQCIVHGLHTLIWGLEEIIQNTEEHPIQIRSVFHKPIMVGETVTGRWSAEKSELIVSTANTKLVTIYVELSTQTNPHLTSAATFIHPLNLPNLDCSQDLIEGSDASFGIHGDYKKALDLFPAMCARFGADVVLEIAALSHVVGMECPGMNSVLTEVFIELRAEPSCVPTFSLTDFDPRFGLYEINVKSKNLAAWLNALRRPPPTASSDITKYRNFVNPEEFRQINALIIGGSRGLGESTAKLIALGGGISTITYDVGIKDATNVQKSIQSQGEKCEIAHLSILEGSPTIVPFDNFTHVFYFATPRIFSKRSNEFDLEKLQRFLDFYVSGFLNMWVECVRTSTACSFFYPSSIAVNDPTNELSEYILAKSIGENLCIQLNKLFPQFPILSKRIPRVATDQTQSILNIEAEDPFQVMLPIIRQLTPIIASLPDSPM